MTRNRRADTTTGENPVLAEITVRECTRSDVPFIRGPLENWVYEVTVPGWLTRAGTACTARRARAKAERIARRLGRKTAQAGTYRYAVEAEHNPEAQP
ncbi:hypothetical protein AB0I66_21470 [Streptomyces sp. NPDC050439]|uniref:hypothetical protein n=1 Tax=unclassified Streptomyces TaxID=2593676 RepID=UPI0034205726